MLDKHLSGLSAVHRLVKGGQFEQAEKNKLTAEGIERMQESLRLYEPLPYQDRFHRETAQQCLVQKGNRTGATLSLMVEIARAVTGTDPYGKYPEKDGKAVVLGYGEHHVGRVFYNGLFKAGHFKGFRLIKDLKDGRLRAYRPWPSKEGGDLERYAESISHGPLIPKRHVSGKVAWLKRSERVFSVIRFTNGWELYAANSAGDPGQFQGMSVNLYAIDEDLATSGWYEEAQGRVVDVDGKIRWTALPHAKNDDMMALVEFAEKQAKEAKPKAVIIRASIFDNKFLNPEHRDSVVEGWKSMGEDVYRKRAHGELDLLSSLMYPSFSRNTHDVMRQQDLDADRRTIIDSDGVAPKDWRASRILAARLGDPPSDWTRYVSIDPGHLFLAIAFLCKPPPELGDQVFLYDLCYLHEATYITFGNVMREKCDGVVFEKFILDFHGGKLSSVATGEAALELYSQALKTHNIQSAATGFTFVPGEDNRTYREEVMRSHLGPTRSGEPRFMYVGGRCMSFVQEMEKFRKKSIKQRGKDIYIDEGDRRAGTHAIDAVEQAIALELEYVAPKPQAKQNDWLEQALTWGERMRRRSDMGRAAAGGGQFISLGPVGVR